MATTIDPTTGATIPLPDTAIQRILFIHPRVHCYAVPPLTSSKGYSASSWTSNPPIFTARLRIIETAVPSPSAPFTGTTPGEDVSTLLLLEDASTGDLFAGAPYTSPSVVAQCIDSSRFFAVRVVGEGGRKAVIGVGFEERSDAFDFGIALQDAGKVLGYDTGSVGTGGRGVGQRSVSGGFSAAGGGKGKDEVKRDYSLKEGQTIEVKLPSRAGRVGGGSGAGSEGVEDSVMPFLPPPPSVADTRRDMDDAFGGHSKEEKTMTAEEMGFDDGEFGEFQ
jgi:hypothetical protein